jgi:low temperature requirement protein LtrA
LIIALAIPTAFDGSGLAFGLAYVAVVAVHAALFARDSDITPAHAIRRLAPSNLGNAGLVLLGGALGGTAQVVLWTVAVVAMWVLGRVLGSAEFTIAPAHFVERHGLVVIVAIGESVVAIGIGAAGLAIDVELVLIAVLGLLLSAGLWWTYFGGDDTRAEEALEALPMRRRGTAALDAFGYAHLVLLLGIVCVAVGLKKATGHAYYPLDGAPALALAGGVAGDGWFRWLLRIGTGRGRAVAAVLALATVPLGTGLSAVVQLAALAAIVAVATGAPATSVRRRGVRAEIS